MIRRRSAALLAIAAALVIMLMAARPGSPPASRPVGRAVGRPQHVSHPLPPALDGQAEPNRERLHVWLRDRARLRVVRPAEMAGVESLLPGEDELGWDAALLAQSATLAAVQSRGEVEPFRAMDVAATASTEGLLDDPPLDTPEEALAALVARWVDIESSWTVAWDAYLENHLPEVETLGSVSSEQRLALLHDPEAPTLDYGPLEELADEVDVRFPGHPVTDRAAVLRIRARTAWGVDVDPVRVADELDLIEQPAPWLAAAQFVARRPYDIADASALLDAVRARPDGRHNVGIAQWGLTASLRAGDDARAASFLADLRALQSEACVSPDADRCRQRAYEVRDAAGRLAATEVVAPISWQEAITAEAWRCHLQGRPHQGVSRVEATWSQGAWTFGPWDRSTPTTDCVARTRTTDPSPDAPVVVMLTLEGEAEESENGPGASPH